VLHDRKRMGESEAGGVLHERILLQGAQSHREALALLLDPTEPSLALYQLQHRVDDREPQGVVAERGADTGAPGIDSVEQLGSRHHHAGRVVARGDRLAEGDEIRLDTEVRDREHTSRAPHPDLDLIVDEQDAVLARDVTHPADEGTFRDDDPFAPWMGSRMTAATSRSVPSTRSISPSRSAITFSLSLGAEGQQSPRAGGSPVPASAHTGPDRRTPDR